MAAKVPLILYIDPALKDKLGLRAKVEDRSTSAVARRLLEDAAKSLPPK